MALFDRNSGLGGLLGNLGDYGFGLPSNTGGLIPDEERDAINKRALMSGLISAGLTYAATPKNLNTGSALPYLGRAGLAGFGASQDVVDRSLNTAYRNQILSARDDKLYNVDGALVDKAGKVVYQSTQQPKINTDIIDVGGKKILINKDTGAPIQEFIVTKPPAEPQTKAEIVKKNLTPLEAEIDKKAADDLVQFTIGGGFSDVQKSLSQLNAAKESLKQTPEGEITGKLIGIQDDTGVLKYTKPNALNTKEQVQEIAQRNLRLILGAAFTAKEGDQLIARVYNPALPQSVNAQRLELLENQLLSAAKTKQEAVEYYNENGTLKGFKGKLYNSTSEFLNDYNDRLKGTKKADATQKMPTTSGFTEGAKTKSKSGKSMIFRNGQWEYE
jgi:hypothetical protein